MPKAKTISKRPHLAVVKELEVFGVIYELDKYCPSKDNLFISGKHIRIKENYLIVRLDGDLQLFEYSMYYCAPRYAFLRLAAYFTKFHGGLPAISPTTKKTSLIIYNNHKLYYKKIA